MMLMHDKMREIQLYAKKLATIRFFGNSRSHVKGSGLEFDQLQDYQIGDDVRAIDWNSSARMNKLLIKNFYDEKQHTLIIALDISNSLAYGSNRFLKQEVAATVAALIAYAGQITKDQVGLILFSDTVDLYIPPLKGRAHAQIIIEKIFSIPYKKAQTNISALLEFTASLRKKNAMLFILSDFIDVHFEQKLSLVSGAYDTIAIRVLDDYEHTFRVNALITMRDMETDQEHIIDLRTKKKNAEFLQARIAAQNTLFLKHGVDLLSIHAKQEVVDQLVQFFKTRSLYSRRS